MPIPAPAPSESATDVAIGPNDYFVIAAGMPYDGTWQVEGEPGYWPTFPAWAGRFTITVALVHVTRTDDGLGNVTETETTQELTGCLFAPRSSTERVDPRSPAVISVVSPFIPHAGLEVAIRKVS